MNRASIIFQFFGENVRLKSSGCHVFQMIKIQWLYKCLKKIERISAHCERVLLWRSSSWKWTLRGGNEFHLPWQFEVKGGEMIKRPRTKSFADESRSLSIFGVLACNVQKNTEMSSTYFGAENSCSSIVHRSQEGHYNWS